MHSASAMSEKELIAAAVRRDEHAVLTLIGQNERSVASGLRAAGLSPSDALYEDAQSQALLAIWQEFPNFRGLSRLSTWMFSIANRVALSRAIDPEVRERRRRHRNVERTTRLDLVEPASDEALADRDLLSQVLRRLSDADRQVLMLRAVLELTMAEIASELFLSEAGAKARYRRARQRAAAVVLELEEGHL